MKSDREPKRFLSRRARRADAGRQSENLRGGPILTNALSGIGQTLGDIKGKALGDGYLKNPFTVRRGHIPIPTGPGLGIELDEEAVAGKIDHDWRNPQTYDADDGSVVDW